MEENTGDIPREEIENNFKSFIERLLDVQGYDFSGEKELFSRKTLEKTLEKFCDLIAEELKCASCTIQLKMYDAKLMDKKLLNRSIIEHFTKKTSFLKNLSSNIGNIKKIKYKKEESERERNIEKIEEELTKLLKDWEVELDSKITEIKISKRLNACIRSSLPKKRTDDKEVKKRVIYFLLESLKYRVHLLQSPLTFPYWLYSKGLACPVAASKKSPWREVFNDKNNELKYVTLFGGISKSIFQDNAARVRDRLSIRETRNFRKLGQADMKVWNNTDWQYVFKNFYGIPIRLHAGGEVIGLLRAENKFQDWKENENEKIGEIIKTRNVIDFKEAIIDLINAQYKKNKRLNVSFLALAYLEEDLDRSECKKFIGSGVENLLFIPYPEEKVLNKNNRKGDDISSLIHDKNSDLQRPPMQLFTRSIEDERRLWILIDETMDKEDPEYVRNFVTKITDFYNVFKKKIADNIKYKGGDKPDLNDIDHKSFQEGIKGIIKQGEVVSQIEDYVESKLPDFHFKVSLTFKSGKNETLIDFYLAVLPTRDEISSLPFPGGKVKLFKEVNSIYIAGNKITLGDYCTHRKELQGDIQGEFVKRNDSVVTDLILDRLAARVQSFALALPLTEFSSEDSYKLKWVAYEIGRLIEREISYRANRHSNPIPLTAMEFYRIPISDLSFVDDLHSRRVSVEKIADNIDVYIKNIISEMDMTNAVEYSSRIKDYRSMFQRIGERFEGYVRGNIALWVFLFALININKKNKIDAKEWEVFLKNLKDFKDKVFESMAKEDADFFKGQNSPKLEEFYGDLKFDSPPFLEDFPLENEEQKEALNTNLKNAFVRICENLQDEGFKTEDFDNITGEGVDHFFENETNRKVLDELLIRNFSHFCRDSLSLLIQVANLLKNPKTGDSKDFNYKEFYQKCRKLREFLCSAPQQLEGKDKYNLERIFGIKKSPDDQEGAWSKIKEFIGKYNTDTVFPKDADHFLKLSPRSIYKRIRMLNNILHRQMPSALLEWELGRFDLYGARLNCLYKHQVFVLYEKIWNKGDPFFIYEPLSNKLEEYYNPGEKINTDKYRQRWLCLRTSFLQGEYNACQIAALIEPKTADSGYWEKIGGYNLKCVQYLLGKIFNEFEEDAAENYRNYSWHRYLVSQCYRKFFRDSAALFQGEIQETTKRPRKVEWFGSFLFSSVINLLMLMLSTVVDRKNMENALGEKIKAEDDIKNRHDFRRKTLDRIVKAVTIVENAAGSNLFFDILESICKVIHSSGNKYSYDIKKNFMSHKLFSEIKFECNCNDSRTPGKNASARKNAKLFVCTQKPGGAQDCQIYRKAIELVKNIIGEENKKPRNSLDPRDKEIFEKIKADLEKEKTFFTGLDVDEGFQMPLFFYDMNQMDSTGRKNLEYFKTLRDDLLPSLKKKGASQLVGEWSTIYHMLKRLRREQKSYLFDKGDKRKGCAGLWIRDKTEVFNRVKNYALLFSKKDIGNITDEDNKRRFIGWNAHDLYYYLRSLIPMEIQVRTELANTFAVQYHDSIYKVQPPPGTEFPHSMIKKAGEGLEKIDREIEIDYEDYILKYQHRLEEKEKKKKDK